MSLHSIKSPPALPLTPTSKISKMSNHNCSKYKQQSQSKAIQNQIRQIKQSQPYKNILNKLFRCQKLSTFINQAFKYVTLTEDIIQPFKPNEQQYEKIKQELGCYGKALLRDGSFIRCYCKLVEKQFPEQRMEIRQMFFENYRYTVCIRERMFNDYFKAQNTQYQCSNTRSPIKSKSQKKVLKSAKNQKKYLSQCGEDTFGRQQSKTIQVLTTLQKKGKQFDQYQISDFQTDQNQSIHLNKYINSRKKVSNQSVSQSIVKSKEISKTKTQQNYEPNIRPSPIKSPRYKKKETEEERDFRLSGLVAESKTPKNVNKNIVKFEDDLKANPRLREIYNSMLKQKQQFQQREKLNNTQRQSIIRSPASLRQQSRIKIIDERQRSLFNEEEAQILNFYPTIQLSGRYPSKGIQLIYYKILGYYKSYLIKKGTIRDMNNVRQPNYEAIIVERDSDRIMYPSIEDYKYEKDLTVRVFLS